MNKTEKKILISVITGIFFLLLTSFFVKYILLFIFSICGFSSIYTDQGEVSIQSGKEVICAHIYTSEDAPYTLIGPYPFPARKDFFFVRKNEVLGRSLDDKTEGDFFILFKWLFIAFDLSSHLDSMAPNFEFDAKINCDEKDSKYMYQVYLGSRTQSQTEISFCIDKRFLR